MAKQNEGDNEKAMQLLPKQTKNPKRPADKARARFNKLIQEIETLEAENKNRAAQVELYHQLYQHKVLPMMQQYAAEKLLLVRRFDAILAAHRFGKAQVRRYLQWVVETLQEITAYNDEASKLLQERTTQLWELQSKKEKERIEKFKKDIKQEQNTSGGDSYTKDYFEDFFAVGPKPETKAASEIDEIGPLYKELAKKLHPDLEQDEKAKAEKHELMQELTKARKQRDVYTMLRIKAALQPEKEPDAWPPEKLKRYNKLLQQKLQTLMATCPGSVINHMPAGIAPADAEKEVNRQVKQLKKAIRAIREDRYMIESREHLEQLIDALE